jgi:two-component system, sensor histidine kinase and response regulator
MDSMRVLVVDDEPGMRLGVARALRDYTVRLPNVEDEVNFTVQQAETGSEALRMISENPPQLMLLDYRLPDLSGLDILETLNAAENPDMLVIMITAYASLETAVTATRSGAYDFLAKPFTPEELRATIRKAAGRLALQQQAKRLAEEKRQVRFQFLFVLAHELKAPLSAIEGYLHILKDKSYDDPAMYEQFMDRCLARSEGMRKLVADLLDLTRIESGQKKRELAELDIREVAQTAIETVKPAAEDKNITVDLHADGPITMMADQGEIDMVFNNLVSNAVKYNRNDGRVDVTVSRKDGGVEISVADTGIGMSKEDAARLFQEFVRIKNEKTRHIDGSGLGLSIVKRISELYDGSVAVDSEPDVGTKFTVQLKDETEG